MMFLGKAEREMKRLVSVLFAALLTWACFAAATLTVTFASANPDFWCGNTNYPIVYQHMGYNFYADVSSAYVKNHWVDDTGVNKEYVCNVITVKMATNESVETRVVDVLIEKSVNQVNIYRWNANAEQWQRIDDTGYNQPDYNTGLVLMRYL